MKSTLCHDLLIVKYVFTSTILNLILHVIFLHVMVYLGSFIMLVTGSLLETNMKTLFRPTRTVSRERPLYSSMYDLSNVSQQ